jgi:hypothetical protein
MKDKEQVDYARKLAEKQQHVKAVSDVIYWVIDELRKRAAEHDSDKLKALAEGSTVDTKTHHQLRHHILNADHESHDQNIIDVIEFMADNIASALYESDDKRSLANPLSSPKIADVSMDKLLRNTASAYKKIGWRLVNDPNVWKD